MTQSYKNHEKKKSQIVIGRLRTRISKDKGSTRGGRKNFIGSHTRYIYISSRSLDIQLSSFQNIVRMVCNRGNCQTQIYHDEWMRVIIYRLKKMYHEILATDQNYGTFWNRHQSLHN